MPAPAMPVDFGADAVRFEQHSQAIDATGNVHVDSRPFHLTSDALRLRRTAVGVDLEGQGRLAFCPCLGTPLAVRFDGATVAPPHDVVLHSAVLEVFGVPVAWAPAAWFRSSGRFGALAPEVAWRGDDGLFAGGGVHVPWTRGDVARGVDLRAGGYVDGGAAVQIGARTLASTTRVTWDRLRGDDGLAVDARGATETIAWDVDAMRGGRAVRATTDVDAAARQYDRASARAAWRAQGWTFASGVRTVMLRGGDALDLGAGGPVVTARRAEAIARAGAYDATVEAGSVSGAGLGAATFVRAEGGTLLAARVGAVGASLALRGVGDLADDGSRSGFDGAVQARAGLSMPLVRAFDSASGADPWVHRAEPRVEVAARAARTSDVVVVPSARGAAVAPGGGAWIAAAGWSNALGRWASRAAAQLDASGGAVGDASHVTPALRARTAVSSGWMGLSAEFARIVAGGALFARARLGPALGPSLSAHVAERDGIDPAVARVLVDAPLEPASGFLSSSGWTGGARVAVPLGARLTARAGADTDLDTRTLVAALGALELHDPCDCVVVRASAAHRIGRGGLDAWLAVELPSR